ncbi:MAG: ferritin [Pseudomonadota bacterium]
MLKDNLQQAFNDQINAETYSSYLYMSMAAYFEGQRLAGFAHWFMVQAQEEMTHSLRFYKFINERGGRVVLGAIKAPETTWASPLVCMEAVLAHERYVTSLIHNLVGLARQENDYASENFLQWFVKEQVEEEANAEDAVEKLKLVNQTPGGMFMLDKDMAARVFTMPIDLVI